jgi:GNAT superfamily N-acetyltransferase
MNPYTFLKDIFYLLHHTAFDRVETSPYGLLGFCEKEPSEYWNHFLVEKPLSDSEIKEVEALLITLKRQPAFYFQNTPQTEQFAAYLEHLSYKKAFEDVWMFYEDPITFSESLFEKNIRVVKNEKDLDVFCSVMDQSYRENDPQNPYGELHQYLDVTRDAWLKKRASGLLIYYVVYNNDQEPCGVGSVGFYKNIGYISNVGTLQAVRGQGFGKLAIFFALFLTQKQGCTYHCLATEVGGFPNQLYERLGFKTRFRASVFFKENP